MCLAADANKSVSISSQQLLDMDKDLGGVLGEILAAGGGGGRGGAGPERGRVRGELQQGIGGKGWGWWGGLGKGEGVEQNGERGRSRGKRLLGC